MNSQSLFKMKMFKNKNKDLHFLMANVKEVRKTGLFKKPNRTKVWTICATGTNLENFRLNKWKRNKKKKCNRQFFSWARSGGWIIPIMRLKFSRCYDLSFNLLSIHHLEENFSFRQYAHSESFYLCVEKTSWIINVLPLENDALICTGQN